MKPITQTEQPIANQSEEEIATKLIQSPRDDYEEHDKWEREHGPL